MKRKYEFQTKTPGLTLQVEESACPETVTLSVNYHRDEILIMCLSRDDWNTFTMIGLDRAYAHKTPFDWTPTNEVTK